MAELEIFQCVVHSSLSCLCGSKQRKSLVVFFSAKDTWTTEGKGEKFTFSMHCKTACYVHSSHSKFTTACPIFRQGFEG